MQIKIEEISNGFIVDYDTKEGNVLIGKTEVYKSTDILYMLEKIGKVIYGKRIEVKEK